GAVAVHGEGAVDAVEDLGGDQVGRLVQAEEGFAAGVGRVVAGQCGAPGRDGGGQFGGEVVVGGGGAAAVRHADQGQGGVVRGRGEGAQDRSPSGVVELPHAPGQPLGCGVLEDVEDLDAPADGPGETDGLDGVAAEGDEVVVDGELRDGEGGPEGVEDDPLGGGGRRVGGAAGDHPVGQGTPVPLAVGREGGPVERRRGGRDQVGGEPPGEAAAQGAGVGARRAGRDDVRGEHAVAGGVLTDDDTAGRDRRGGGQRGLDLAGFDAEAVELHLVVGAPPVVQEPVGGTAGEVPGPVHAGAGRAGRVGDETRGGEPRLVQVAVGELGAGDVDL